MTAEVDQALNNPVLNAVTIQRKRYDFTSLGTFLFTQFVSKVFWDKAVRLKFRF